MYGLAEDHQIWNKLFYADLHQNVYTVTKCFCKNEFPHPMTHSQKSSILAQAT